MRMCGIFGMVLGDNVMSRERRAVAATLLAVYNETRGEHSWGMAAWNNGAAKVRRGLYSPLGGAKYMARENVWLGHSRYATVGDKTVDNSHPFQFEHIIGAHNGGVSNHYSYGKKMERNFAVDSMHIFANIAAGLPLDALEGYGAIEYIDTRTPESIFLSKMRAGELGVLGIGKDTTTCKGILWSSDIDHAWEVVQYVGIDAFSYKLETGKVYKALASGLYETELVAELSAPPVYDYRAWKGWGSERSYTGSYTATDSITTGQGIDKDDDGSRVGDIIDTFADKLVDEDDPQYQQWLDENCYSTGQWVDASDPVVKAQFIRESERKDEAREVDTVLASRKAN